jgi:hypothetical protein
MKRIKTFCVAGFLFVCELVYSQPSYYDLSFDNDSIVTPFKSSSNNFVFVRSKRGVDGVNQTSEADAIRNGAIQKIVLVFSEDAPEDLENREEYNMERWDNLILTYPEFFQEKTKYKNVCQCTPEAGGEAFKEAQGFYIYYKAAEKAVPKEEKKVEPEQKTAGGDKKQEPEKTSKAADVVVPAVAVAAGVGAVKSDEKPAKEPETKAEAPAKVYESKTIEPDPEVEPAEKPVSKPAVVAKKPSSNKPRRAKDPKACRPAFYGTGDEDLDAFFKNSFSLDKKQKKQAKKVEAELRIQLNVDGSVKRVMVICENAEFKSMFEKTLMGMGNWNAAVRGGVTIRSEVRLKVKYDKESKGFKKFEMVNNPKPGPKCKMQSDEELFGS